MHTIEHRLPLLLLVASVIAGMPVSDPARAVQPAGAGISCPAPFAGIGTATTYPGGTNHCGLDDGDGMAAAISGVQWEGSIHCGECLEVAGPGGVAVVRVVEVCNECPVNTLDLQPAAWDAIAGQEPGMVEVAWQRVPCPVTGPIAIRLQASNPFYLKLQVRNHRYGIAGVTLLHPDGPIVLPRAPDNHFEASGFSPALVEPVEVMVTATTGERRVEAIQLLNDTDMPGSGQFVHCTTRVFEDGFETPPAP